MFFPGSRYAASPQYTRDARRTERSCAWSRLPTPGAAGGARLLPPPAPATGSTRSPPASSRDATQFWRICDANGAVVPDALAGAAARRRADRRDAGWLDGQHLPPHARRPAGGRHALHADRLGRGRGEHGHAGRDPDHRAALAQQRRRPDLRLRPALRAAGAGRGRRLGRRQRRAGRRDRRGRGGGVGDRRRLGPGRRRNASSTATCSRRSSTSKPASPTPRSPSGARTPAG